MRRLIGTDLFGHRRRATNLIVAGTAVVAVAVVGIGLATSLGDDVSGPGSGSPTPSSSAQSASPRPAVAFPRSGRLDPGFYPLIRQGVQLRFHVPTTDWTSNGEFHLDTGDSAELFFWTGTPEGVNVDPCGHVRGPVIGPDAEKLAAAVASIPGTVVVAGPERVTIGGFPTHRIDLTIPEDTGCSPSEFHLWFERDLGDRYPSGAGHSITVWIIDVDGALIWIDAETSPGTSPESVAAIETIVGSISLEHLLPAGNLEVGRFVNPNTNHVTVEGASYRTGMIGFSVPATGWIGDGDSTIAKGGARIVFRGAASNRCGPNLDCEYLPDRIYADPCTGQLGSDTGTSTVDVATALTAIPGVEATEPMRVRVNMRAASLVTLTVREDAACDEGPFHLWFDESDGPRTATAPGDTLRIWIIDHQFGFRIWIEAETPKDTSPGLIQEIERIIYSSMDIGG